MKPTKESRIRTKILTGEGPDGEDIVQFIDSETDQVMKEEIRRNDARTIVVTNEAGVEVVEDRKVSKAVVSAAEMMRLAIREKEQTFGKRVQELLVEIMEGCKAVILEGTYRHAVLPMTGISADIVKQAASDLKGLGYKVKVEPDPGTLAVMIIKWPIKEEKVKAKKHKEVVNFTKALPEPPVVVVAKTPAPLKGKKRIQPEAEQSAAPIKAAPAAVPDDVSIDFKGGKEMPAGWRPAKRPQRKAEID